MSSANSKTFTNQVGCDLESVIATLELDKRPSRTTDLRAESHLFTELTHELAKSPKDFFQKLVDLALNLSLADSTGISLLNEKIGRFVWPAVAGGLHPYLGEGTPSDFGPCGTVLERDAPVLFQHPERHFTYLEPIKPPLEEVLLIPFRVDGKTVGTIWAVIHTPGKHFQSEDKRMLTELSQFASVAYKILLENGFLEPLLQKK